MLSPFLPELHPGKIPTELYPTDVWGIWVQNTRRPRFSQPNRTLCQRMGQSERTPRVGMERRKTTENLPLSILKIPNLPPKSRGTTSVCMAGRVRLDVAWYGLPLGYGLLRVRLATMADPVTSDVMMAEPYHFARAVKISQAKNPQSPQNTHVQLRRRGVSDVLAP